MAVAFVGTVVWEAVDSGKRDRVGETAELEAPSCALWGLLITGEDLLIWLCLPRGRVSILFLQVLSDV